MALAVRPSLAGHQPPSSRMLSVREVTGLTSPALTPSIRSARAAFPDRSRATGRSGVRLVLPGLWCSQRGARAGTARATLRAPVTATLCYS